MTTAQLGSMMQRWYRGQSSDAERAVLLAAKYLTVTNRTYHHLAATTKGYRVASQLNGASEADIREGV